MYKKYFVTGATGFLGRAVVGLLLTKVTDIYALVMKDDLLTADLPDGIHIRVGNVCDPSSLDSFLEGADGQSCVIHCAGIVSVASRPGEQLYNVNVGGTKNIIDTCISHGVGKLVYVSSVHALAEKPKGVEIDAETDAFDPNGLVGDYAKSKAMATHAVLDAAKTSLDASVVLPSGIIGQGEISTYTQLANAVKNGGEVSLKNNIEISEPITVDNDITVILNGRTLSGAVNNMFDVRENAALTLLNGIIVCESDCCVCASGAQKVKFERCNVKTSGGLVCSSDSEIMFDNCTVSGNALSDKLVRFFSGAKLVFRNEIEFMGQIEREDDSLLEFPNVKGKFAFDPNDYSDSCYVVKNNDSTWSVN